VDGWVCGREFGVSKGSAIYTIGNVMAYRIPVDASEIEVRVWCFDIDDL
jgi:hypothetical protein